MTYQTVSARGGGVLTSWGGIGRSRAGASINRRRLREIHLVIFFGADFLGADVFGADVLGTDFFYAAAFFLGAAFFFDADFFRP